MAELPRAVRALVKSVGGGPVVSVRPLGGGDTSHAASVAVQAEGGTAHVFAKWAVGVAGETYAAEAEGLRALAAAAPPELVVPEPLARRAPDAAGPGALVLPELPVGRPSVTEWRRFGGALAALHRAPAPGQGYGWHADNWIGSKPQRNGWSTAWPEFFGERRLLAQRDTVRARGAWDAAWDGRLDRLVTRLPELLPPSPPRALVHGDLWAGNALATEDGRFALIDPAVYVGHREVDLAMTELFGGFPPAFYDGYREAWPPATGYAERREVYNLFHLVNHLTHGPQYRAPVEATLRRFGA